MTAANVIWHATLDQHYRIEVVRRTHYTGTLSVTDQRNGTILSEQDVTLSYGAVFGPDVDDVYDWQERALRVVDAQPHPEE